MTKLTGFMGEMKSFMSRIKHLDKMKNSYLFSVFIQHAQKILKYSDYLVILMIILINVITLSFAFKIPCKQNSDCVEKIMNDAYTYPWLSRTLSHISDQECYISPWIGHDNRKDFISCSYHYNFPYTHKHSNYFMPSDI